MSDNRECSGLLTLITGAIIGAGVALLYAPQSGKETRKQLKDAGDKAADNVKKSYENLSGEAQKAIETVKDTSEKAVTQIKNFIDTAKESIKTEAQKETAE